MHGRLPYRKIPGATRGALDINEVLAGCSRNT